MSDTYMNTVIQRQLRDMLRVRIMDLTTQLRNDVSVLQMVKYDPKHGIPYALLYLAAETHYDNAEQQKVFALESPIIKNLGYENLGRIKHRVPLKIPYQDGVIMSECSHTDLIDALDNAVCSNGG